MSVFVRGWVEQCKRFNLRSELILIEWNPPADRAPLREALPWPSESGPCTIRVITVPAAMHDRFEHASKLPLYQMIAKNVGLRRARGRFALATNIDLLFSDELGFDASIAGTLANLSLLLSFGMLWLVITFLQLY
jgi:hypothetical protein